MRLCIGLGLLALACGEPPAPDPVALEDFGARAVDAVCAWSVRCRHTPSDAECRRLIDAKQYDVRRALDAAAAGRLAYDAAAAGRCLRAVEQAYCLAAPFGDAACGAMFAGLVGEGGACTSDLECAEWAVCEDAVCDAQCCAGACGPPGFEPGEPPARAAIGEPCATHPDCVEEAYCETDGVCTAHPTEEGQRCLFGCARGDLYCDLEELSCKRYGQFGEPCPCDPAWAWCDGAVCRPRPGPGEACGEGEGQNCVASAWCDGDPGVCRARGGAGAACASSDQCDVACDPIADQCVEYRVCELD